MSNQIKPENIQHDNLPASDQDAAVITYGRGVSDDGRKYWCYIAVRPGRYQAFLKGVVQKECMCFKDYGDIVCYGYDDEVPDRVKKDMERRFGCDEKHIQKLSQDVRSAQAELLKEQEDNHIGNIVAMLKKNQLA